MQVSNTVKTDCSRRIARLRAGILVLAFTTAPIMVYAGSPDAARQAELRNLVKQDCGSCHGMTLRGGLGPALTADHLRGRPAQALVETILEGRPKTPMPPWRDFLSREEAAWIVQQLQSGAFDDR